MNRKIIYGIRHVVMLWLLLLGSTAYAHQFSTAYLMIHPDARTQTTSAEYRIAIRDLAIVAPVPLDAERHITWGAIRTHQADIIDVLNQEMIWTQDQHPCITDVDASPFAIDHIAGLAYLVLTTRISCHGQSPDHLDYHVLENIDAGHRLVINISQPFAAGTAQSWITADGSIALASNAVTQTSSMLSYLKEGIHHILTGYDHLLFLLCLLLPSVYLRRNDTWVPVDAAWTTIKKTLWIATAFTLAHSITLSLAALQVLHLPSRLVESSIAFSIAIAALNNLYPKLLGAHHVRIAFGFGLLHGFGFASALSDLPIHLGAKLLALLTFNLGIELGQISCIVLFLPLALSLRHLKAYRVIGLRLGSMIACVLAIYWMIERLTS